MKKAMLALAAVAALVCAGCQKQDGAGTGTTTPEATTPAPGTETTPATTETSPTESMDAATSPTA